MPGNPPETFADLGFPTKGIDLSTAFGLQRVGTTPVGKNVRTFEPTTDRSRGGSRPGLVKYIAAQLPNGAHLIQHLNLVVDPAASALLDSLDDTGTTIDDPSSPGPPDSWIPGKLTRIPLPKRKIRVGGHGRGMSKNRKKKASVLLVWPDPAKIDNTTALSGTQLNATAEDSASGAPLTGTFDYTPPAGTVLADGDNQLLLVQFTPDDSSYPVTTATAHINVRTIHFIQAAVQGFTSGTASGSRAFPGAVTTGNLLVVAVGCGNPFAPFTCNDSLGNVYTLLANSRHNRAGLALFTCISAFSGGCTVTVTWNGTPNAAVGLLEYDNVDAGTPVDSSVLGGTNASVTALTTGAIPVNHAGELVIGAFCQGFDGPTTFAPGGGFNLRCATFDGINQEALFVADKLSVATSQTITGTLSKSCPYASIGASFIDP